MKFLIAFSLLSYSAVSLAALPPGAESLRRINMIAESREVLAAVGGGNWINSITGDGTTYQVTSEDCITEVKLEVVQTANPPPPGPPTLKLSVGQTNCLP